MNNMSQPRILLVEDDKTIQKVLITRLNHLGCFVKAVSNGYDALLSYHHSFHLILLDLGLPDMSGIEVCKQMRRNDLTRDLPIIVTTTWGDSKAPCLAAGVDD